MDILISRRSCRTFTNQPLAKDVLDKILYAGLCAPSAMNLQKTKILVFQDLDTIQTLSKLNAEILGTNTDPLFKAPAVAVVFYPKDAKTGMQDASLVMGNLMNEAYTQGVGSCWINRAKEMFELEAGKAILTKYELNDYAAVACCILGYPDATKPRDKTIDMSRIIYE